MSATITLHPDKQTPILRGHPWIFPNAIQHQTRCRTGELVRVLDINNHQIAMGVYNEHSLYRVRVLARASESLNDLSEIIEQRIKDAILLRERVQLPNNQTTAYRLFNSEGDGLSGLTIDRFNDYCVISSSAYWVELHRDLVQDVLKRCLPGIAIFWQSQKKSLMQDGWAEPGPVTDVSSSMVVKENGIQFQIDFSTMQKTGLFLDQRENHLRLAAFAKDARVLDLYTYTGGFALHAARAQAKHVLGIDSSAPAIELATQNAKLNQLDNISFVCGDARTYLEQAGDYDLVILDPPKLMPSRRNQTQAKNYYRFLHRELFKAMKSHSLFMSCNCSSAMRTEEFTQLIFQQALSVNKTARILGVYGPSLCHPVIPAFPEGHYLTAVLGILM